MTIFGLLKNTNIIKVHPDEHLSSAISKLSSSHDAAFVFDEEDKFKGVINPYYCLIKSSNPANSKVEHCIFHAPRVKLNYSLSKVAQLMIESKVHYLPVFNGKDEFIGIVSARRVLESLKGSSVFKVNIKEVLKTKKRPVVTVYDEDFISTALNSFKTYRLSKLVVISHEMKLKGILTYYDLISYLIAPKEKEHAGERSGNKVSFAHQKVKNFSRGFVLTLTPEDTMEEALRLIIEKKIGSVVIVDKTRHPIGIITSRDFLALIAKGQSPKKLEIIEKNLSQENRQIVGGFFNSLNLWAKNIPNLVKARLFVKEEKDGGVFKVNLSLFPKKGEPTVIKKEGKNLLKVLKKIKRE